MFAITSYQGQPVFTHISIKKFIRSIELGRWWTNNGSRSVIIYRNTDLPVWQMFPYFGMHIQQMGHANFTLFF